MIEELLKRAKREERTMRANTGMSRRQFQELCLFFEQELLQKALEKPRERRIGGGRKSVLKNTEGKVFFILFYLKIYPTYDFASLLFLVHRMQPCRWVKSLLPILEKALRRSIDLPKRRISSFQEFQEAFPETFDILIDVTERKAQRPFSDKNIKRRYSGKKKYHTRKNTVIVDDNRRIGFISRTRNGRFHDFALFKKESIASYIPNRVWVWADKAYTGIKNLLMPDVAAVIPKKKKKKTPLTQEDKQKNKAINSIRALVEHAIGGMKRFTCMQVPIRNKDFVLEDLMPLICAGLWNFHLKRI